MDNRDTILVLPFSTAVAHVARLMEVSKGLHDLGHEVVFGGGGPALALAQQAGFAVRPLPELDIAWALARIWQGPRAIYSTELVASFVQAELALLTELQPALVVVDGRLSGGTSATLAGRPWVSLLNAYITPCAVNGMLAYTFPGPPPLLGPGAEAAFNQVRGQYGLPAVASTLDLLAGDLNLMCDVPEYAPVQDAPAHYRYVGPIIWDGTPEPPDWLSSLDPGRPTIYFTMGSTGPVAAFQAVLEAFGGTEYQVLMTTGGVTRPEDLRPLPTNFHVAGFAPGDELMRWADVVICHAGNGTTYQALRAGLPVIAWPFIQDQRWNARRQAELGVGLTLAALNPAALRAAVEEVQSNSSYRAAAQRFQQILTGYDGPRTAAQLIHEFIRQ
ncbi:MAG: glycosyltransferase [Chloroflexi bacterium]|nr:glycosyltransferase [Chloroflexota bacterium]